MIHDTLDLNEKRKDGISMKRQDYLKWDDYFMGIALLSAQRSKDPSTSVGCCIVSKDNKILSVGYNGMPAGCSDDEFPWDRDCADPLDTKYLYVAHSELNAILNYSGGSLAADQHARDQSTARVVRCRI